MIPPSASRFSFLLRPHNKTLDTTGRPRGPVSSGSRLSDPRREELNARRLIQLTLERGLISEHGMLLLPRIFLEQVYICYL